MLKGLFFIFSFFFIICFSNAQDVENRFVQFIITNLDSREQAVKIDQNIKDIPGIIISRTDIVSKKYLCIYNPLQTSLNSILESLHDLKIEFKCLNEGIQGKDRITDLKFDCENK